MTKRHTSLLATLLLGLIALLGFHSCSTPEEITDDDFIRKDSIGDVRLMYGVPNRSYMQKITPNTDL